MTTFLFWNINKRPLQGIIADLVEEHNVDVLILAESDIAVATLLLSLNRTLTQFSYAPSPAEPTGINIYTRFSASFVIPIEDTDRLMIRSLQLPGLPNITLVAAHWPSKMWRTEESQLAWAFDLADSIRSAEERIGHDRTILVGDLNMNPFESGVIMPQGLHGVMTQQIAKAKPRNIREKQYSYFYNPMWSLFGDLSSGPAGTYYYFKGDDNSFYWNMFDQVLIRPDLLDKFDKDSLKIIDKIGSMSLLSKRGIPNRKLASDHLPLVFTLNL